MFIEREPSSTAFMDMNNFPWNIDLNQLFTQNNHARRRRQAAIQAQGKITAVNEYLKQKAEAKEAAEAEEQATYEAQKQVHKDNADIVILGTSGKDYIDKEGALNPSNGKPVKFFIDAKGVEIPIPIYFNNDYVQTAEGNDVIYAPGFSYVKSEGGDDVIYMEDAYLPQSNADKLEYFSWAFAGNDNDQILAEDGGTHAFGGDGDDLIDLGNGFDTVTGGRGADEFIVDLQNTGCDIILDFMDVGDKITIKNGDKDAAIGEWYFLELPCGDFTNCGEVKKSLEISNNDLDDWLLEDYFDQKIMAIQNSDGQSAAYFVVGAGAGFHDAEYHKGLGKFDIIAEVSSSSIQITSSDSIDNGANYSWHKASFTPEFVQ